MKNFKKFGVSLLIVILYSGIASAQQEIPEKIKPKIVAGINALENAKTPADMDLAVKEFSEAALMAPEYPDVHYFLGKTLSMMQGNTGKAIQELKKYLELYQGAPDKEKVMVQIGQLEAENQTKSTTFLMGCSLVELPDGIYVNRVGLAPVRPMTTEESIALLNLIQKLNNSGTSVIGKISVGDKIIKINDTDIKGYTIAQAMKLIENDVSADKYWRITLINGGEQYLLLMTKGDKNVKPLIKELGEEDLTTQIKAAKNPVVVFFMSDFCEPCEKPFTTIKRLSYEYKEVIDFITVNISEKVNTAKEFQVNKAPVVCLYKNGNLLDKIVECDPKVLIVKIDALSPNPIVRNPQDATNPRRR